MADKLIEERLNDEAATHQTVYDDDRRRKALFAEAAAEIARLRERLAEAEDWKSRLLAAAECDEDRVMELAHDVHNAEQRAETAEARVAVLEEVVERRIQEVLNYRLALNKIAWAPHFGGPVDGDLAKLYREVAIEAVAIGHFPQNHTPPAAGQGDQA